MAKRNPKEIESKVHSFGKDGERPIGGGRRQGDVSAPSSHTTLPSENERGKEKELPIVDRKMYKLSGRHGGTRDP